MIQQKRRPVPAAIDAPIKLLVFDKEDGMVAVGTIVLLYPLMDNALYILMIAVAAMVIVNRLKADKPKGYIIHQLYRFYHFSCVPYQGVYRRLRP